MNLPPNNDDCHYLRPGSEWNSMLDRCLSHALCGPVIGKNSVAPHSLSTIPFDQCAFSPLERSCEEVCTFASTQRHYILQPWYGCETCGMVYDRGSCRLCSRVCHRDHEVVHCNTSDFFCDCAAEMGEAGKCRSLLRWVGGSNGGDGDGLLVNFLPWMNTTCFEPTVYDDVCALIAEAASRHIPVNVEVSPANHFSLANSVANTVDTVGPVVSTAIAASVLPPCNSELMNTGSVSTDVDSFYRIRRTNAFHRRRDIDALKSTSREGGSSVTTTRCQPSINLVPCLSVIYDLNYEDLCRRRFNLWTADFAEPRQRAVEVFQQKYGRRPQPVIGAILNRLRIQMSHLAESERECILNVIKSPRLLAVASDLLRCELTSSAYIALPSFADVFKHAADTVILRSRAIGHLLAMNRRSSPRVLISSRLVTPVFLFNLESKSAVSAAAKINELYQLLPPQPISSSPSPSVSSVTPSNLLPTNISAANLAKVFSLRHVDSSPPPPEATPVEASAIVEQGEHSSTSGSIATLARIPSVSGWRNYLLIAMPLLSSPSTSHPREVGLVSVFHIDDLLATAAECQKSVENWMVLSKEVARDSSSSPEVLQSFVLQLSTLPQVSAINCGFAIKRLSVHPTNEALFTISNHQTCAVLGLSTLGQVCGRLTINPSMENKDDFVIKPIWLPRSSRFIALLTTNSVQIFDIFTTSPKLLFYFKPVVGTFVDATFAHVPWKRKTGVIDEAPVEVTIDDYDFSNVILVAMTTFGSMLLQRLLPIAHVSQGHFYLAKVIDWEGRVELCKSTGVEPEEATSDSLRDPSSGVVGEGGVSVFYAPSLCLLMHSYKCGHTFATAFDFSDDGQTRTNYSLLLTGASFTPSQANGKTDDDAWSGPLHNWAEVNNHACFLTATSTNDKSSNQSCNLLIAVEPDTVWMHPLPCVIQCPLFKPIDEKSSSTGEAALKLEGENRDECLTISSVTTALTTYWSGNQCNESRLFTLQISRNGAFQVFAGPTDSHVIDTKSIDSPIYCETIEGITFAAQNNLLPTLPGQFWLQPALLCRQPQISSKTKTLQSSMPLEDLSLWDVSTNTTVLRLREPNPDSIRDFASYALSALPALRIILERNGIDHQSPICDFYEWASPNDNVNFYSRDLASIYNHDTLNYRLKRAGMPLVFSGRSPTCTPRARKLKNVAFVIDIEVARPAEEVIVGLRVEFSDTHCPQFLSVYDRVVNLDTDELTREAKKVKPVNLPLKLSEILQLESEGKITKNLEPLRLYVGQSNASDTLTSIDRILVYAVRRELIDPSILVPHVHSNAQSQLAESMREMMLRLNDKTKRVVLYNASLVRWFDRLMATGFVTSIANLPLRDIKHACEFASPLYDNVEDLGSCLVTSLVDFFQPAWETIKPNLEELQPFVNSSLTAFLPEAFVNSKSTAMCLVSNLILLHASFGSEDSTAALISPHANLASLINDFLNVVTSSTTPLRLSAFTCGLAQLSEFWQTTHEYCDGPSVSNDLVVKLFTALQEHLIVLAQQDLPSRLSPELNALWVKLIQSLVKVAYFVLAESMIHNDPPSCSTVTVVGDLVVYLLTHKQAQIACYTRDILCSALVCHFCGNGQICKTFFDSSPFPSCSLKSLSSHPPHSSGSIRNKSKKDESLKRANNTGNNSAGNRTLHETVQFMSSTSDTLEDGNAVSRRHSFESTLSHYRSFREVMNELRCYFGSHRRARTPAAIAFGVSDPIFFVNDFAKFDDAIRHAQADSEPKSVPDVLDEGGRAIDGEFNAVNASRSAAEGGVCDENCSSEDEVRSYTHGGENAGDESTTDVARDIFQYVVDLLSSHPTDSVAPASSITTQASQPHDTFPLDYESSGPGDGASSSPSGNNTLSHLSSLLDAAFLDNVDEDVLVSLVLQRSIQDQGDPETVSLMEDGALHSHISTKSINETPLLTATNSPNPETSTIVRLAVPTQMVPPNNANEADDEPSAGSSSSNIFGALLPNIVDEYSGTPSTPSSSCPSWSFSSHLYSSDDDDDCYIHNDDDVSGGRDSTGASDATDRPSSPPLDPPSGVLDRMPSNRRSLSAARACVALTRYIMAVWQKSIGLDGGSEMKDSNRLVPLMQTAFTLCRLLEAIAQCSELSDHHGEAVEEVADAAKATLANLVTTLATSLILNQSHQQSVDTSTITALKPTPRLERFLLLTSLFGGVLCGSPKSTAFVVDDCVGGKSDERFEPSCTALLVGTTVLNGLADLGSCDSLFTQCMDACLSIFGGSNGFPHGNSSSDAAAISTADCQHLPLLTTGLLQCALGVNFSSLTNGFGVGLTNCAPLLDAQASLMHLRSPLVVDFGLQLAGSVVRLAIVLFQSRGSEEATRGDELEERRHKWWEVVHELLESLTLGSPVVAGAESFFSNTARIKQLSSLMHSLLILIVGPKKHHFLKGTRLLDRALVRMRNAFDVDVTQEGAVTPSSYCLPLSYTNECLMLDCISTCLDVAMSDRSTWQRHSYLNPDNLILMLEFSLCVRDILALGLLTLVLLAVRPDVEHASFGKPISGRSPSSPLSMETDVTTRAYYSKLVPTFNRLFLAADGGEQVMKPSAFLQNFVRGNICCRADQRIRLTATVTLISIMELSDDGALCTALRQLLPRLWSELPSFAPYGDEFVILSTFLLNRQPNWSGALPFCTQLLELLLSQLNAVVEHPRREIYKTILKMFNTRENVPDVECDPPFPALRLPVDFISTVMPTYIQSATADKIIGCPSDLEPCLLCNHSFISSLPYILFQWDSSTPSRRRRSTSATSSIGGVATAIYPMPTHNANSRLTNIIRSQIIASTDAARASADASEPIQSAPTTTNAPVAINLKPPTWVSPNVHIFSLLDAWEISSIGVRFMAPAPSTRSVRILNIFTSDAFECPPSRLMHARHLWHRLVQVDIPYSKYNVLVHLTSETAGTSHIAQDPPPNASSTVEIRLSDGLPITANNLIFHYAAFHGGTATTAADAGQIWDGRLYCTRCNLSILQGSTCQSCNLDVNQCSRCQFINLSDEEVFLCTKCGSSNYNFMNFSVLARPNFSYVSRLRDEEDRRIALARIYDLTEELSTQLTSFEPSQTDLSSSGPCTPETSEQISRYSDQILKTVMEMDCVQLLAVPVVYRLWALRQAVALYDGRCGANSMDLTKTTFTNTSGDSRCLRCVGAAICMIVDTVRELPVALFSVEVRRMLISQILSLMNSLPSVVQAKLMAFLSYITVNSIPLINHLGDCIVERLLALSRCEMDITEFNHSSFANLAMLERSLKSVIPTTPPLNPDYVCEEAHLRIVFRLFRGLAQQQEQQQQQERLTVATPSTAVMECLLVECVRFLNGLFNVPDNLACDWLGRKAVNFTLPPVNFEAWMRGDVSAAFSTWRAHYRLAEEAANIERRVRKHITTTASRELALIARFGLHWQRKAAQSNLPPLAIQHESPANCNTWLTPLLWHCFASHQYMPSQIHGIKFLSNICFDSVIASSNRLAECLCYLVSQFVPHMDRLVSSHRGSGMSDEVGGTNPLVILLWRLTSGGTVDVEGVMELIRRTSPTFAPTNTTTAASGVTSTTTTGSGTPLPMRPLLLHRGRLLDHVEVVLQRCLSLLSAVEGTGGVDNSRFSLPLLRNWTDCLPSRLAPISGSSAAPGVNPAYVLMHISDLLAMLYPLNDLASKHQDRLYAYFLHAIVKLQPLVYQRTAYTVKAELVFNNLLQQLMQHSASRSRDFIRIIMDCLTECPMRTDDQSCAVFLFKCICACACPFSTEVAPFPVCISVWPDQEEYLFVRSVREVIMSNTRGFGPTISAVINYICAENNLTTDMQLEVVCENNILMPQLLLEDGYKYLWLQNPNNVNTPMELIYRIPGLVEDNLPYILRLPHPVIPEERYCLLAALAEHPQGLGVILNRLTVVKNALKCRDLLHVSGHLLEYCLKVPQCHTHLVDPQYRAVPILLEVLYACLQVTHSASNFHDQVTSRLVEVLTTLLHSSTTVSSDANSICLPDVLTCLVLHSSLEVVQSGVAQFPGLLAFGVDSHMVAIADFLRQHIVGPLLLLLPSEQSEGGSKSDLNIDLLQCCCTLVTAIPSNTRHGRSLRARLVKDLDLLELCVAYLWRIVPLELLDLSGEDTLDIKHSALSVFLCDNSLPFVLQLLRGCVWSVSDPKEDPPLPPFPAALVGHTTRQLLVFLHKLEYFVAVGRVGLLIEDLFNEWTTAINNEGSTNLTTIAGVVATVRDLRTLSEQRHRRTARECREKYLLSLNMKVNEKGQVAITAESKLAEMVAEVVEETGLQCAICHEGLRSSPSKELGIYAFFRSCRLEESFIDVPAFSTASLDPVHAAVLADVKSEGYTTVSSFVVVHFDCHKSAVESSSQDEWSVATRHNRDALCNCLLPVLMNKTAPSDSCKDEEKTTKAGDCSMDDLYANRAAAHAAGISSLLALSVSSYLALQDVKMLLVRFARQRPFHGETGGGARESNLNLIPHLMQLAFFYMEKEQTIDKEWHNVMALLELPETHWSRACWEATGPLYGLITALHLFSWAEWIDHRVALLRQLMIVAYFRASTLSPVTTATALPTFAVYKPYLLFFGLIQALYNHFFNSVKAPAEKEAKEYWWPKAVSEYIRSSDEQLITATPHLLNFFENDLLPIESIEEFLDVMEMLGDEDVEELIQLAKTRIQ